MNNMKRISSERRRHMSVLPRYCSIKTRADGTEGVSVKWRYPPTVMHIFCDGRDKIFCIIGALRFMTIFLLTAMKSAHVFPGNLPEFVFFLALVVCFRCQLWFTLSDLLNKTRFHDLINFKKWFMSTWQLNHVRWLGRVTGSHNMYAFMWTFVFLQNFSFPFSPC